MERYKYPKTPQYIVMDIFMHDLLIVFLRLGNHG